MNVNKQYVVFNYPDLCGLSYNKDGYYAICLEDLYNVKNVSVINYPMEGHNTLLRFIHKVFKFFKAKGILKKLSSMAIAYFYPLYFTSKIQDQDNLCFVFVSDVWDMDYMRYLKKKYPNCKIVMALRDLVKTKWFYKQLKEAKLVDCWMSYDEGDCKEYNMHYFSEFESKIHISKNSEVETSDVFFTGRAKDRLPKILEVYDRLTLLGLKCLFIILDAPESQQVKREGIVYTSQMMSYRKMLEYSINSKCLLDINQAGATGYTSRFLEAVIYNKLLLTNNSNIKNHPLYDERYIKIFNNVEEISLSDFDFSDRVQYNYSNEFSPLFFISEVDKILS